MIYPFNSKTVNLTPPAAIVNGASFTVNVLDTLGFDYVSIKVILGATDIALTACKVQESDVKASATTLTGGVDITGTVMGTDNNDTGSASTLPSATDDNHIFEFLINLAGGRKRYLLPVVTIGTGVAGGFAVVIAELHRAKEGPRTAVDAGDTQRMIVP